MTLLVLLVSCKLFEKEEPKPVEVYGCMDSTATNYNPEATINDGSCDFCNDSSGVLLITNDGGITWDSKCINIQFGWIVDISVVDDNNIWICTAPNIYVNKAQILHTNNGGYTWTEQYNDFDKNNFFNYIKMFDENNGIALGDGKENEYIPFVLKTIDGGETWIESTFNQQIGITGDLWRRVNFININTGFIFASLPGIHSILYKTTDSGNTWIETNYTDYVMALNFYDENIGLIVDYPGVIKSVDGFNTWDEISFDSLETNWGQDVEFHPSDPSKVWIAYPQVYFSSDTGNTWVQQQDDIISSIINLDYIRADDLYVGENKIWAFDPYYFNRTDGILFYSQMNFNDWNYLFVPILDGFNASGVIDGVGDQIIVIPGRIHI